MEIPAECARWKAALAGCGDAGRRSAENFDRDHDLADPRPQLAFFQAVAGVDWDRAESALKGTLARIRAAGAQLRGRPCAGRRELVRLIRASSLRHALEDGLLSSLGRASGRPIESLDFVPPVAFARFDALLQEMVRGGAAEVGVLRVTSASPSVFATFPDALQFAPGSQPGVERLALMLGIDWARAPNCYLVRYTLPEGHVATKPTAFDGCGQRHFRAWGDDAPHGFTEDLRATEAAPTRGLPEVVHGPVLLDEGWGLDRLAPGFVEVELP